MIISSKVDNSLGCKLTYIKGEQNSYDKFAYSVDFFQIDVSCVVNEEYCKN